MKRRSSYYLAAKKKLTLKQWIFLGAVEIAFTLVYFGFIWPNLQLYSPLGTFSFPDNEWFDARVEITDPFTSSRFTVANDELFYNIKYTNKKPYAINVQPELQVLYGGKVIKSIIDISPVTLNPEGSGWHHVRFFTDSEGINQIVFKVNVINATNSSVLGKVQETYNIRVLSIEAFLQLEQNNFAFWGVLATGIAAIASIYIGLASVILSRKQNELTTRQMESSLRPWIGVKKTDLLDDAITFDLHNYGQLPSTSAKIRTKQADEKFAEGDVISSPVRTSEDNGIIFPNGHKTIRVGIGKDSFVKVRAGVTTLYIGVSIEYNYADGRVGQYGFIVMFDHAKNDLVMEHEWTS
ncbi:MAG: hypothetical protein ACREBU_00915 [Nitrososphaera sp.]